MIQAKHFYDLQIHLQYLFNITELTLLEFLIDPLGNISNHKSLFMLVQLFFPPKIVLIKHKKKVKYIS